LNEIDKSKIHDITEYQKLSNDLFQKEFSSFIPELVKIKISENTSREFIKLLNSNSLTSNYHDILLNTNTCIIFNNTFNSEDFALTNNYLNETALSKRSYKNLFPVMKKKGDPLAGLGMLIGGGLITYGSLWCFEQADYWDKNDSYGKYFGYTAAGVVGIIVGPLVIIGGIAEIFSW
jgi:hypothetical protein